MRIKSRQVGTAGVVYRHADGTCVHECRACGKWALFARWGPAIRAARGHAGDHAAGRLPADTRARYALTAKGVVRIGGGG